MTIAIIFSTASLVLWVFSFLFFFSYLKRRTGQERILAEFREEVDLITADINDVTVRNIDLLEDRIKTLKSVSEETERRIRTLIRELDRRNKVRELALAWPGSARETGTDPVPEAASPGLVDAATASGAPTVAAEPQGQRDAALPVEGKGPSFAEQVAELYQAGLSLDAIAARLNAPMAKVNLAIALAERRGH
ncbi:MAG: hypothetical protein LBD78_00395 [Spirochaetaceae bacterium]|jgi:hypothetical protein|nr:hypothetical protein [Spirochaetaceae bacterium]